MVSVSPRAQEVQCPSAFPVLLDIFGLLLVNPAVGLSSDRQIGGDMGDQFAAIQCWTLAIERRALSFQSSFVGMPARFDGADRRELQSLDVAHQ